MGVTDWMWFHCTRLDAKFTKQLSRIWPWSSWLNAVMIVTAKYTPITMLAVLVIASMNLFPLGMSPMLSFWSVASAIVAALVIRALHEPVSRMTARPRPFDTEPFEPLVRHDPGDSFPSNHAAGAFALAVGASHLPFFHIVLLVLAFALAISRIYCGLHHFTDVFAGAAGGTAVGMVVSHIQTMAHLM